ncbi:MAG: bestrophin family ion channel [Enhygromyxa sp.]
MLLDTRIPVSYVFVKIRADLFGVVVIAGLVELLVNWQRQYLPTVAISLPILLGTAISLLLSFKLNQSYDRWWEARKIWGSIVNDSRTLVRQLLTLVDGGGEDATVRRVAHRQIAWCYCLGQSLRGLDWRWGTAAHVDASELAEAEHHTNKSLALLQFHARDVAQLAKDGRLSDYRRVAIDETLTRLTDWMGMAERIRNTVFPRTYRLFLHAFIYVFITLLSIALAEIKGTWQLALTIGIAIPFFLLEKTATHMQDPFANRPTDTSVTAIARTIDINLRNLIGEEQVPDPWPAEGYYIM